MKNTDVGKQLLITRMWFSYQKMKNGSITNPFYYTADKYYAFCVKNESENISKDFLLPEWGKIFYFKKLLKKLIELSYITIVK